MCELRGSKASLLINVLFDQLDSNCGPPPPHQLCAATSVTYRQGTAKARDAAARLTT
jgi:hypothetical protein